jgi:hypothetical protein
VPPPAQRLRDARRVQELRTRTRALQRRRSALQTLLLRCCRRPSRSASCLTLPCIRQLLRAQVVSPTPRRAIARRVMPSRGRRRKGAGRRCGVTCEPTATGASADDVRLSMCDRARYPMRHVTLRTHWRRSPLRCRAVPRRRCVARTRLKPSSVYALAYGRKCADMNSANLCSIGHALFLLKWTCAIRTCRNSARYGQVAGNREPTASRTGGEAPNTLHAAAQHRDRIGSDRRGRTRGGLASVLFTRSVASGGWTGTPRAVARRWAFGKSTSGIRVACVLRNGTYKCLNILAHREAIRVCRAELRAERAAVPRLRHRPVQYPSSTPAVPVEPVPL